MYVLGNPPLDKYKGGSSPPKVTPLVAPVHPFQGTSRSLAGASVTSFHSGLFLGGRGGTGLSQLGEGGQGSQQLRGLRSSCSKELGLRLPSCGGFI